MVSANECVLSGYFGCRQQFCMVVFFCLLIFALFHGDRVNMLGIDWVNHVVLDGGCVGLKGKFVRGLASEYATRKPIVFYF